MSALIAANRFMNVIGQKKISKISFVPFANLQREIKKLPLDKNKKIWYNVYRKKERK